MMGESDAAGTAMGVSIAAGTAMGVQDTGMSICVTTTGRDEGSGGIANAC